MNETAGVRLRIHGLVQGVGFRYALQQEALHLGLTGWVRNRRDGSVEAVASGAPARLESLVAWARRGPAPGRVDRVDVEPDTGSYDAFEQRPTE